MVDLEQLRTDFEDQAEFLLVYVKEAHPEDEWASAANSRQGVLFNQPTTIEERLNVAQAFVQKMGVEADILVDDIDNTADELYAAWPERIYVIDAGGMIVYKGGIGPYFFDPDEVREFLEMVYFTNSNGNEKRELFR